jgi:hypothetical protein
MLAVHGALVAQKSFALRGRALRCCTDIKWMLVIVPREDASVARSNDGRPVSPAGRHR